MSLDPGQSPAVPQKAPKIEVTLHINGERRTVKAAPMARLLDVLRENLRLTGTKEGCGEGECGACSVLMNGRLVNSCLVPVAEAHEAKLLTIEGLSDGASLSPVQQSFLECGAAQCGICTPGMVLATHDLLMRNSKPSVDEVKSALAGNICRCTGYMKIIDAALDAASKLAEAPEVRK